MRLEKVQEQSTVFKDLRGWGCVKEGSGEEEEAKGVSPQKSERNLSSGTRK